MMKYLVAFALFAVAVALPEPVRLLEPAPVNIAPLVVPQEVMDEVALKVKVVDAPQPQEAVEDVSAFAVKFVDEPVNSEVAPAIEDVSAFAVNFVDEAVNSEVAPAIEDVSAFAVNFVDEAVNSEVAPAVEDVSAFAVNFVDEAVNAEAPAEDVSAFAVNFVDEAVNAELPAVIQINQIPLPESVILPLDSVVLPSVDAVKIVDALVESSAADAVSAVKIVDVADVDEETPSFMPIKQYPDPRWR